MAQAYSHQDAIRDRIWPILERVFDSKPLFQEKLKRGKIIDFLCNLAIESFTPEQLSRISDEELARKLKQAMMFEAVSGTLNDLTPEEMGIFDAAVERKFVG